MTCALAPVQGNLFVRTFVNHQPLASTALDHAHDTNTLFGIVQSPCTCYT